MTAKELVHGLTRASQSHDGDVHPHGHAAHPVGHGAGSGVVKRIAAPMVGGVITSFILELLIYPVVFTIWKWNWEIKPELKAAGSAAVRD